MRRDVSGWGLRWGGLRRGPVSQRLSLFRKRPGSRSRRRSARGGVLLTHEPLEPRQMLAGTPSLTDAQYQARLATLNTEQAAALSGAAKAQEQADKTWQDAQGDSKSFYASWEQAAYYGGELPNTNADSAPPEKVSGLLVAVVAADLTKAKEIAKAKGTFDASEGAILATEQGTIGRASSAFTLVNSAADATYKSKVDSATFGLLATSTTASAKYDAVVTKADATFASTSQWAANQRDAAKASADAEEAATLAIIAAGFDASASAAVGAFETSVAATTAAADTTQKRLDAAADTLVAYGTRLEDEIIVSAKLWHDGAIIAAGLNQRSDSTAAANGLADAKKKVLPAF